MISLNFTLVVELVLFLIFLGVTNRLIFRPLLRIMDEREATVARDKEQAAAAAQSASALEVENAERVTEAHRAAPHNLRSARDEAYRAYRLEMEELRKKADQELGLFRAEIAQQIDGQRTTYPDLVPSLVKSIDERLHVEGSVF